MPLAVVQVSCHKISLRGMNSSKWTFNWYLLEAGEDLESCHLLCKERAAFTSQCHGSKRMGGYHWLLVLTKGACPPKPPPIMFKRSTGMPTTRSPSSSR